MPLTNDDVILGLMTVVRLLTDLFLASLVADGRSDANDIFAVVDFTLPVTQKNSQARLLEYCLHASSVNTQYNNYILYSL